MRVLDVDSLWCATELRLLEAAGSQLIEHDDRLVVSSPHNPHHYWGNFVLFGRPPQPGELREWEAIFERELPAASDHRLFVWDVVDGEVGAAAEFVAAGYELERTTVLTAGRDDIVLPERANGEALVRPLESDADWAAMVENGVASREERFDEAGYRTYYSGRARDYRRLTEQDLGTWMGAFLDGRLVADLGIFVFADTRLGRFQSVGTHPGFRRRGLCTRLVHDAAIRAVDELGADTLVMVADEDYHAARIYESVGFRPSQRFAGVCRYPS